MQLTALRDHGCNMVFFDKGISGARFDRPGLRQAFEAVADGGGVGGLAVGQIGAFAAAPCQHHGRSGAAKGAARLSKRIHRYGLDNRSLYFPHACGTCGIRARADQRTDARGNGRCASAGQQHWASVRNECRATRTGTCSSQEPSGQRSRPDVQRPPEHTEAPFAKVRLRAVPKPREVAPRVRMDVGVPKRKATQGRCTCCTRGGPVHTVRLWQRC